MVQNTIDPLEDSSILHIYSYLSQQYDMISLQVDSSGLILLLGKVIPKEMDDFPSLLREFHHNSKYITPANIDFLPMSGYKLPVMSQECISVQDSTITHDDHHLNFFLIYDLEVLEYHSKIYKILLEIPGTTVILASSQYQTSKWYFSIRLRSKSKSDFLTAKTQIINNLKNTPYFNGKLTQKSPHTLKQSIGKYSIGITTKEITKDLFLNLLSLLPEIISPVISQSIPVVFPRIDLNMPENINPNTTSGKTLQKLDQELMLDPDLIDLFQYNHWKVVSSEITTDVITLRISNQSILLELLFRPNNNQYLGLDDLASVSPLSTTFPQQ